MNSLSWFIYLTQIVDNLGVAALGCLVFGGMIGFFAFLIGPMAIDVMDSPPSPATIRSFVRGYIITMVLAVLVSVFMPSRQTMLMIAGSEMGERLVKSESVNNIVNPGMDLIRKWIQQETDKIKIKDKG